MNNYGIAKAKVEVLNYLPYVEQVPKVISFDISADALTALSSDDYIPPYIESLNYEKFSVCFPPKRKLYIDNYLDDKKISVPGTTEADKTTPDNPYILWTPVNNKMPIPGVIDNILHPKPPPTTTPPTPTSPEWPSYNLADLGKDNYKGPIWKATAMALNQLPSDKETVEDMYKKIYPPGSVPSIPDIYSGPELSEFQSITQTYATEGLWWAVESSDFLSENMPFFITINRYGNIPAKPQYSTFFYISLGANSINGDDRIDLCLSVGNKPIIYDYRGTTISSIADTQPIRQEIGNKNENDLAKLLEEDTTITIGLMTVAGRLVIYINQDIYVYERPPKTKTSSTSTGTSSTSTTPAVTFAKPSFDEVKIAKGRIRIYGTNVMANLYVSPMVFFPLSYIFFPLVNSIGGTSVGAITYKPIDTNGVIINKPVCVIPKALGDGSAGEFDEVYGVDCYKFTDANGSISPKGYGFHKHGYMSFWPASAFHSDRLAGTQKYVIVMQPTALKFPGFESSTGDQYYITNGCPYFFRIKGQFEYHPVLPEITTTDITSDVISVEETVTAQDLFQVKKSATIKLYNKNGKYDTYRKKQKCVRIYFGWNTTLVKTFTGLTTNISSNESPGKETLTLQCEDYMYILENTYMINSPFYDGMLGWAAVKNIAKRAGIKEFVIDWEEDTDYFLPCGYAFTEPAVVFDPKTKLIECIKQILMRFVAYVYFDGDGKFHIGYTPGGLLYSIPDDTTPIKFTIDPEGTNVLLGEKNIDVSFDSTVSGITVTTVDRNNWSYILQSKASGTNILLFQKWAVQREAMFGDSDTLKAYIEDVTKRIFNTIRKVSFQTVANTTIILPLSFITIDDIPFRVMSIRRSFNADQNDLVQQFDAKWLGG